VIARKIEFDTKQRLQQQEAKKKQEEEALRQKAQVSQPRVVSQYDQPEPEEAPPDYMIRTPKPQPKLNVRGKITAYDASGEPIDDAPKKGIMAMIGSPVLLILLMVVISWGVSQVFGSSGSSSGLSKMETVVNMIEVQRGQDVASIEKLNTQVAGLQDQINKLPKTSGSGTDYSAQINTINQQITSINQLIGTINQVEAGIKTRLSTLENAQIKP
jgi:hypothetical protein